MITTTSHAGVVVRAHGRLDAATGAHLIERLRPYHGYCRLVLDCTRVSAADSAGLRALHTLAEVYQPPHHDVVLIDSPATRQTARLFGLCQSLQRADTVDAALATPTTYPSINTRSV